MGILSLRGNAWVVIAVVAVASGCSDAFDPALPPSADVTRLQFIVDSIVQAHDAPGAVVGVVIAEGQRYTITSGVSDLGAQTSMSADNRFRVGSVTKTMVATVALQLVDEGRMKLDDAVEAWLPAVVPNGDHITIRQLLNHTSGIADYLDDRTLEDELLANPSRTFSFDELIAGANRQGPRFSPGASWAYSNSNYLLLGALIERVTSSSLGVELKSRIFDRLNMVSTLYPESPAIPAPFSHGYIESDGSKVDVTSAISPTIAAGSGAAISTVSDLLAWADALARGTLISSESRALQLTPVPASGGEGYGLGVQTFGHWVGHSGEFPGYEASVYSRPGVGTIVVLVNMSPTSSSTSYAIFDNVRWAEFGFR